MRQGNKGDRIKLINTTDEWTDIKPGDEAIVTTVDDMGTVHCRWDSGSTLGLVPGIDRWVVLEPQVNAAEESE